MKKVLFLAVLVLMYTGISAQKKSKIALKKVPVEQMHTHWSVDPAHSSVTFTVSHMTISEVEGKFKTFDGTIDAPSADFNNSVINFNVDVTSISTDNDYRDKHLKSDDFFNAEKYPKMTFASTSFKKVNKTTYLLEGNLTIRDVTKKVTLAVVYGGTVKDPMGNIKAGFRATGKISRKAFGLKWSKLTEAGGAVVGDEVTMKISLEFAQQKS